MASTPAEYFATKGEQLKTGGEKLASINATYLFELEGDGGGSWVIELTPEKQEVRDGAIENPTCQIKMKSGDFMSMVTGKLNPQMAFMTGKLRVKGDMAQALKLQAVLG